MKLFRNIFIKNQILKIFFCLILLLCSYNNLAYMESLTEESMEQAKILSDAKKVDDVLDEHSNKNMKSAETEVLEEKDKITPSLANNEEADTFVLKRIVLDSEIKATLDEVNKATEPYINKKISIKELQQVARNITQVYRSSGYLAAIAYVPGQETTDGIVTIKVVSGKFGDVAINNESKLDTDILNSIKKNIRLGSILEAKHIENVLYRINGLGGVKATGALEKIKDSTDIRLNIKVVDNRETRTIAYAENYGNENSGRYRFGVVHNSYNVDNYGSNLEVGVLFSNKNLRNYHVDFSKINNNKTASRMGISIGRTTYSLAKEYDSLNAKGTSNDITLYNKTTLFQSDKNGLNFACGYRYKDISDEIGAYNISTKKHSHAVYAEVSGYNRVPKGIINYDAKITVGKLRNDSEYAKFLNKYNNTEGNFIKFNGKVNYLQAFDKHWNFHTTLSWQQANKSLDGSEKMFLGGINGVRAYSSGDGSGDKGWLSRSEFIYHTKVKGLSLNAFFDIGAAGNKSQSLKSIKGYGISVNYQKPNDFFMQLTYARKIGFNEEVSSDKGKGKIWFMVGKVF